MNAPAGDFKTYGISQIRAIEKQMHQMIARWEAVSVNQHERSSKKNEKLIHFGNLLRVLFTRPADRQTGTKLILRQEECISVDLALFPDLERNPILKDLVEKEPGFVPYYTVQTEAGGLHVFNDFAGPLTDMKPNNDGGERYDDNFKMWNVKEFDNMAGSLELE